MPEGYLTVELTGAGVVDTINRASEKGIILYGISWTGDLSVVLRVSVNDYFLLNKLAAKQGDTLSIRSRRGLRFWAYSMVKRPLLMLALAALVWLSIWLPGRVLFINVDGNKNLTSQLILQTAEECGIFFGAKRGDVRSETVKNQLLQKLPQIQWAGVNTYGCTAVISVREDSARSGSNETDSPSSIIASRDGVILSITAVSGNARCSVGDAVKEGQVLISGRSEEGILCRFTRSQGEVFAQTTRECTSIIPTVFSNKVMQKAADKKYSLLIGKKRINLSKDSGFYYAGYDKIYREYCVILPGGFALPFALAVEEYLPYEQELIEFQGVESLALDASDRYVEGQMISGEIISRTLRREQSAGIYKLFADYLCTEMIGIERNEELEFIDGEDRGTDRER